MAEQHEHQQHDANKKKLADERAAREKRQAEQHDAAAGWKPTPTQEENDLAAVGEHVLDKEPDGSPMENPDQAPPPDEGEGVGGTKKRETRPAPQPTSTGNYQTRTATPAPAPTKHE
jgi:hypothetical protein